MIYAIFTNSPPLSIFTFSLTHSHHWHMFSFPPIPLTVLWMYKEFFKVSPLALVTVSFRLLCDPCCWEGGGQLLSSHVPERGWWTVGLLPVTGCLWLEEKLWALLCICVCVCEWHAYQLYTYVRGCVPWVVSIIKTWYSNTCWVCLQRNALLLLGVIKWQQLAVGLLALLAVNHNHKDKIWPHSGEKNLN